MEIKTSPTKELLAAYNRATGQSLKRFRTRAEAERRTAEVLGSSPSVVARRVNGPTSSKVGRPKLSFSVHLTDKGQTSLQKTSLRMKLIQWLQSQPRQTASTDAIDAAFQRSMRGVVQKLLQTNHLERSPS